MYHTAVDPKETQEMIVPEGVYLTHEEGWIPNTEKDLKSEKTFVGDSLRAIKSHYLSET
jgi:hypothetical protein